MFQITRLHISFFYYSVNRGKWQQNLYQEDTVCAEEFLYQDAKDREVSVRGESEARTEYDRVE